MTLTFDVPSITVFIMIATATLMGLWHIGYLWNVLQRVFHRVWVKRAIVVRLVSIPIFCGALGFYLLSLEGDLAIVGYILSFIFAGIGSIAVIGTLADDTFWEGL